VRQQLCWAQTTKDKVARVHVLASVPRT
jgi:hypothetical protein